MPYYNNHKQPPQPQDAEKLTAELSNAVQLQETMKTVNAYWRKFGGCVGAPGITEEQAKKLEWKILTTSHSYEKVPYSTYDITNNNAAIKRLESKLAEVSRGFDGWEFEGGTAEANKGLDRLQLFFDEKQDEHKRAVLKANGFKWAPSQDAYQRQLNDNAIYAANRLPFLKPTDGKSVREHQPKAPAREDAGAR